MNFRATPDDVSVRDLSAPLDSLLVDAAAATTLHRWLPGRETVALAIALARQPRAVSDTVTTLVAELTRVAVGTSAFEPSSRDRRFADQGWRSTPLLIWPAQLRAPQGRSGSRRIALLKAAVPS